MNIMKIFGFDESDDDYDDNDDYQEERRKKSSPRKENNSRSGSSGKLILFNVRKAVADEDKRRLCDEFSNGSMILVDMTGLSQREYEEFGHEFITFMRGAAFARGGDGTVIGASQYIMIPKTGAFEVWPKEDVNE